MVTPRMGPSDEESSGKKRFALVDGRVSEVGDVGARSSAPGSFGLGGSIDPDQLRRHNANMERFRFAAPYGKYADKAAWFYGFPVNGKIAWLVQECPSFFIAAYCWYIGQQDPKRATVLSTINPTTVLLSMYLFHYFNRSFVYPLRIRGGKPTPFVIMMMAFAFCMVNGYLQGRSLATFSDIHTDSILSFRFVVGVLTWAAGLLINWQADDILRNLRKPGDTGYRIPYGGAFQFVSGANFFGEIVEWAGFALAANSLPAAAFAAFTFLNIGPRGAQHHEWLKTQFKDYPRDRSAVIPFVY